MHVIVITEETFVTGGGVITNLCAYVCVHLFLLCPYLLQMHKAYKQIL